MYYEEMSSVKLLKLFLRVVEILNNRNKQDNIYINKKGESSKK